MRELIYKDDAIRIANGYCHPENVTKELAKLPAVEPEIIQCKDCDYRRQDLCCRMVGRMSDLISRQEALIAIMDLYPGMPRVPWLRKEWARRYEPYIDAEKAIRRLSSAQPERNCEGCRLKLFNDIMDACKEQEE